MLKRSGLTAALQLAGLTPVIALSGCASWPFAGRSGGVFSSQPPVRRVVCIYDQKPWLSADAEGDRDPEGIRYRVFLDVGRQRGVFRDGTFHVQMYRVGRAEGGKKTRDLISDWHYTTDRFQPVRARILGEGYLLSLRWARKDIAGRDVEIVTSFEDPDGRKTRAPTKRLRVPKYEQYVGQVN